MITTSHQQSHTVGQRPSGGLLTALLLILSSFSAQANLYKVQVNLDDIRAAFGDKQCITGHLSMAPTAPLIMQQDNHVSSTAEASESNGPTEPSQQSNPEVSNLEKDKTPMCLVNELARYNKIEHQYRLTNEEGPPHKKKFTVTLKFGNEEYTADGASIKKAQHAAASIALKNTQYDHPPPKSSRNQRGNKGHITPTVELNALAMKRGEPTVYTLVESPQYGEPYNGYVTYSHRGMYTQAFNNQYNYGYGRGKPQFRGGYTPRVDPRFYSGKPLLYKVVVKVGERAFTGEGVTSQAARHDAASKALQLLMSLPIEECPARNSTCPGESFTDTETTAEIKSPISLVHEIALKRNLNVLFEVIGEKGQPHMRTFVTRCCVGENFESIGEGNGKKVSKKRAAEKMLELLRTLPPTTNVAATGCIGAMGRIKKKSNTSKKKSRNLIKDTNAAGAQPDQKFETENTEDMNPISRLMQIQQAKREKEPVYTLREERGVPRRREFVMEVKMGENSFIGSGPNKKIAKRNAAEGLLQQLGYASSTLTRSGHPLPQTNKQVRFSDEKTPAPTGGSVGRQLVPGLLLMNDNKAANGNQHTPNKVNLKTTATIAKEYLNNGNSPTADALAGHKRPKGGSAVRPTEQLRYLAQVLNFHVQFTDFPKGNHTEFLSLVSLNTDPPQVCHGNGSSMELSHDQASLNALRSLSEMGLDSITPAKKEPQPTTLPTTQDNIYLNLANPITKEDTYVNGK